MSLDDLFSDVDETAVAKRKPKSGKDKFTRSVGGDIDRRATQKATGTDRAMHGQYRQANFRLPPEDVDTINDWSDRLGVNKSQLKRWIAWRGLQALEEGERPDFEEVVKREIRI